MTIYGSPMTPQYGNWVFQYPRIRDVWRDTIPDGTDILLTHGPPRGPLDTVYGRAQGCEHLLRELWRVKDKALKLAVFGHIHESYGRETLFFDSVQRHLEESLSGKLGFLGLLRMALMWLVGRSGIWLPLTPRITLVNAAHKIYGRSTEGREPVITYL